MHLAAFVYPTGYHTAAWRRNDVPADMGVNFRVYRRIAELAESAKFDFLFFADSLGVRGTDWPIIARSALRYIAQFEPLTLIAALAATTERIGLIATASTTYTAPYHIARQFLSADHISAGRAGWNIVTSQNAQEAANFGSDPFPDHALRYARAEEFVEVVCRLWDSWSDAAFVRDKATGRFFDAAEMRMADFHGRFFDVSGPLNLPRSPQGRPVLVQSGASEAGRTLAARTADVVFTAQPSMDAARNFYADLKRRAEALGRDPDSIRILPGMFVYCAKTRVAAEADRALLQDLIDPLVARSIASMQLGGIDLSLHPLDGRIPPIPATDEGRSRRALLIEYAHEHCLTLGELLTHIAGSRGHCELVGSADDVADELVRWSRGGCADGFCIMPPYLPGALEKFCELVVPRLQARGVFRTRYEAATLRGQLGLHAPGRSL